jgi:hypothetical protein
MSIGRDLDIAWFKITMQNGRLTSMKISQRVTHRGADQNGFVFGDIPHAFHTLT